MSIERGTTGEDRPISSAFRGRNGGRLTLGKARAEDFDCRRRVRTRRQSREQTRIPRMPPSPIRQSVTASVFDESTTPTHLNTSRLLESSPYAVPYPSGLPPPSFLKSHTHHLPSITPPILLPPASAGFHSPFAPSPRVPRAARDRGSMSESRKGLEDFEVQSRMRMQPRESKVRSWEERVGWKSIERRGCGCGICDCGARNISYSSPPPLSTSVQGHNSTAFAGIPFAARSHNSSTPSSPTLATICSSPSVLA
jgi:hypothetical protein